MPIIIFVKQQIIENHTLPFWNNLFFSGTPLLPDPQSPLFYLPNAIFLLLPVEYGFLVLFFFHSLFGGIGIYLVSRYAFRLSVLASVASSVLYIAAPKFAGYLEAGHYGLITSHAWLPFVILAVTKLSRNPNFSWSLLLAVSLAAILYSHTIIFVVSTLLAILIFLFSLATSHRKHLFKCTVYFTLGGLFTFGLTAIALLPQLEWLPQTTRFLLLDYPEVAPTWNSIKEFVLAVLLPWFSSKEEAWHLDIEKWLSLGFMSVVLAVIGFLHLKKNMQFMLFILGVLVFIIALNNASPFHSFFLSQDWYVLGRISTRIWFIPVVIVALLAGVGIDAMKKMKCRKGFLIFFVIFAIVEVVFISWLRLFRPPPGHLRTAPQKVYEFLAKDKARFRVFCVNRCLLQEMVARYGLETAEGYGTVQQKNYYEQFMQLSQGSWNRYTLTLPPFEINNFRKIQPNSLNLADYNIKYVISPYQLKDKNLTLETKIESYFIYRNTVVKNRAYFTDGKEALIAKYTPNRIVVDTRGHGEGDLVLSEVYNPGWKAFLDKSKEVPIFETPNALRGVRTEKDTNYVDFIYYPLSFNIGKWITFSTLLSVGIVYLYVYFRPKRG